MCNDFDLAGRFECASAAALLGFFGRSRPLIEESVLMQHALQQSAIYALRAKSGMSQDASMEP
eukprot:5484316-Karenia_brevis.AAC.1